jgi:hypothetical protein
MALVEEYYSALNSGDWYAAFEFVNGETLGQRLPMAVEGLHSQFAYDCELGETAGFIICTEDVTDDLYGPAGITNHASVRYAYHEGRLIVDRDDWQHQPFVCSADLRGDSLSFLMEFRVWAADAHPELERYWLWGDPIDSVLAVPCTVYPFRSPEAAVEICKSVPEFVAQSDHWPIVQT